MPIAAAIKTRIQHGSGPTLSQFASAKHKTFKTKEYPMLRRLHLLASAALILSMPAPLLAQNGSLANQQRAQQDDDNSRDRERQRSRAVSESSSAETAINYEPTRIIDNEQYSSRNNSSNDRSIFDRQAEQLTSAVSNEFEQYVGRVVGRQIKRFGSDMILPAGRDFSRAADATIPPDYRINVGDTVSIALAGSAEGSVERTVDAQGNIFLPAVGTIHLAGVRQGDLHDVLMRAIGTQFRNFRVGVRTKELRGLRVFVTGFAQNPGSFSVGSLSTAFNAILQAGGPASGGSFRSAKLVRNGQEVADIDLYDILINGNRSRDVVLENEDVIVLPPIHSQVALWGSVNREAIFEIRGNESLADILRFAGGVNELADATRLIVYSSEAGSAPGPRMIMAADFATTKVRPGDIVQVLPQGNLVQPVDRQSVLVRLEGEVNSPGNYFVAPGTPLEEVIKMAGGLTDRAYSYGTQFHRQSIVVQQRLSYQEALDLFEMSLATAPLNMDSSMDSARQQVQLTAAQTTLKKLRETEPDGRLVLDISPDAKSLPSDLLLENADRIFVPAQSTNIGVFGAVYRPASFQISDNGKMRIKDYLDMAGGPVRAADKGEVFVVRANGHVLTRSAGAMNARALPGDVVFVPVKTHSRDIIARIGQVTSMLFQFGLAAATVAAIK